MSPLFLAALALVAWEIAVRKGPLGGLKLRLPRLPPAVCGLALLVLVAAFAAQIGLCDVQASQDGVRPAWLAAAPYHLVDDAYPFGSNHLIFSALALALALVQTAALFAVVAGVTQVDAPRLVRAGACVAAVALGILALASPVVTSGDVFGYVGIGMLKAQAYARPSGFFHGEFARVFASYPIRPVVYGPVWIAINATVVGFGASFAGKILALRLFGTALLLTFVALLRVAGFRSAVLWAVALNPMLWFQFVSNAHNDLLAIVLVAAALLAVRRRLPWLAIALVAAAGAVKLPFVILGIVVFAEIGDRRRRVVYASIAIALALAGSYIFGGTAYVDAILSTGRGRATWPLDVSITKAAVVVLALGATGAALWFRRFSAFAGWLYPGLGPLLFPWYLAWAIPYACVAGTGLLEMLLVLPVAATLADTIYALDLVALAAALLTAVLVCGRLRRGGFAAKAAIAPP